MEDSLNLDFLEKFSPNDKLDNLNELFNKILNELQFYLNLEPLYEKYKILLNKNDLSYIHQERDFYNIGIERKIEFTSLTLIIHNKFLRFLPIILLREAYNCFLDLDIINVKVIQIFIDQIVQNRLSKYKYINEWKSFVKERIVSPEFLKASLDRLDKFFKLKGPEFFQNPVQFFFEYIRMNSRLIQDNKDNMEDFYDQILKDYIFKMSKSLNDDDIIESLNNLIKLFYEFKIFHDLKEYENYFKEFKDTLNTEISYRKFAKNLFWINKFSNIAPTYQINWRALNATTIICNLRFNPLLRNIDIQKILYKLPFFFPPKYSRGSFSLEVSGYVLIPIAYLNDFIAYVEKLSRFGYVIKRDCYVFQNFSNFINLNYFRKFHKNQKKIVNLNHKNYNGKYEIEFNIDYKASDYESRLSVFDWLLLDRIRYVSSAGFTFERKSETLNYIKSDLVNEILNQHTIVKQLKSNLDQINSSTKLKSEFISLLDRNLKFGFFYLMDMMKSIIISLNLIKDILIENSNIKNIYQFQEYIKKKNISQSIEDNIIFNNINLNKIIYKEILPHLLKNDKIIDEEIRKYQLYHEFLKSCGYLRIFSLNSMKEIIINENKAEEIYSLKEEKLRNSYEKYKLYKITNKEIDKKLEDYLNNNPPLIRPALIDTIYTSTFARYYPIIILKDTEKMRTKLEKFKKFFPRVNVSYVEDLYFKRKIIYVEIYLPTIKEINSFVSIFYNNFKNDLISLKRHFWSGIIRSEPPLLKNFYDFENKHFFYTQDLFEQFFIYTQKILGDNLPRLQEESNANQDSFWSKENKFLNLVDEIEDRLSREHIDLNITSLNELYNFYLILRKGLLNKEEYKNLKQQYFFRNYVKSIKFIPVFQNFGFGQYFLYFRTTNLNLIDFRLLFANTFQKINYTAYIDNSNSFFFKFLWPFRNPNMSYLNWLTKSKKIIREYCLFFIKKLHQIFHLNYNIGVEGWNLDPNKFKIYFKNILFNPDYKVEIPHQKVFNIGDLKVKDYFYPESSEFRALLDVYNWNSIDLKSYLGTRKYSVINSITDLLEKQLIFPYLSLKNIGLTEKVYIILPNVKPDLNEVIIKIFSFFNVGFIYEIEGEFYINGIDQEKKFENGIMIKLNLPDCALNEFEELFDLLFHYLKIDHYLILNDLIDGKNLLKSTYSNLNFLDYYNPVNNLIWNNHDKKWMNHKLFDEKFESIYPDLFYGKKK